MTFENNNTVKQREHPAFEDDYIAPHRRPSDAGDRLAFAFVKALRFVADRFFAGRYGHRAVVLETVAAVPGMVGGLLQHLKAVLRYIRDDYRGWINRCRYWHENVSRTNCIAPGLCTFIEIAKPTVLERLLVLVCGEVVRSAVPSCPLVHRARRPVASKRVTLPAPMLVSLRYIRDDRGWIKELLNEAENERMHLMTFIEIAKPTVRGGARRHGRS